MAAPANLAHGLHLPGLAAARLPAVQGKGRDLPGAGKSTRRTALGGLASAHPVRPEAPLAIDGCRRLTRHAHPAVAAARLAKASRLPAAALRIAAAPLDGRPVTHLHVLVAASGGLVPDHLPLAVLLPPAAGLAALGPVLPVRPGAPGRLAVLPAGLDL